MRYFEILKQPYMSTTTRGIFTEQRPNCMLEPPLLLYVTKNEEND